MHDTTCMCLCVMDRDSLVISTRLLLALCCSVLAADVEKHQASTGVSNAGIDADFSMDFRSKALSVAKAHAPNEEAGEAGSGRGAEALIECFQKDRPQR